ncbi:MAG: Bug family tripartite tricarboxylate transporter substrate binding protein [Betaproteobacteria bacterium]
MKALIGFAFALVAGLAQAQSFPSKPMRLVVPYPPGGVTDILGRALAQLMGDQLGQSVIVDNKPGAGGAIGTDAIAKSAPDGHTFGLGASSTHVLNPMLYKLNYDPVKDFSPIGMVSAVPLVFVVHPSTPVSNLTELLAFIRANPARANYGSYGNASLAHLAGELFKSMTRVDMTHVPYKGSAPLQIDVMGNQVLVGISDMSATPHIQSGKLKPLALTAPRRVAAFPNLPTASETPGLAGFEATGWFALYGPAGIPRPVLERLNAVLTATVNGADLRGRLTAMGLEPATSTPEALASFQRSENVKWQKVIADAKIKVE